MTAQTEAQVGSPSGSQPIRTRGRDWWLPVIVAALGSVTGAFVLWAAAFDWGPFAGPGAAYMLGYLLAVGTHGLAVSLIVVNPVVSRRLRMGRAGRFASRMPAAHRNVPWFGHIRSGMVLGAFLAIVLVIVDRWVLRAHLGSLAVTGYFVAAAVGVLVVSAPYPKRFDSIRNGLSEDLFAGLDGLAVGASLMIAVIVAASAYRQSNHDGGGKIDSQQVPAPTGTYLALGDSYSAGEGLRPFDPATDATGCHRSQTGSYSTLLDNQFMGPRPDYEFRACSGAVTGDIYRARDGSVKAQADGAVHPEVRLVTLLAGGNDVGFSKMVVACFKWADCRNRTFTAGDDMPPLAPLRTWGPAAIQVLADREAALYGRLRHDYPQARIIVIGYPYLFSTGRATLVPNDCASVQRRFSQRERQWVHDRIDDLNNMLYAETVRARIEFVSTADAWDGHEPCGAKGQYTNSLKPLFNVRNPIDGGSFHPTSDGQRQIAALLESYLNTYQKAPDVYLPGRKGPLTVSASYCPSSLGLRPPFGEAHERCP